MPHWRLSTPAGPMGPRVAAAGLDKIAPTMPPAGRKELRSSDGRVGRMLAARGAPAGAFATAAPSLVWLFGRGATATASGSNAGPSAAASVAAPGSDAIPAAPSCKEELSEACAAGTPALAARFLRKSALRRSTCWSLAGPRSRRACTRRRSLARSSSARVRLGSRSMSSSVVAAAAAVAAGDAPGWRESACSSRNDRRMARVASVPLGPAAWICATRRSTAAVSTPARAAGSGAPASVRGGAGLPEASARSPSAASVPLLLARR
mmetsp:Transcript_6547/g.18314  ORF Transcript_6547/g.18314 Transcript_6547/m.18314 type:complete len:265 (-) Transcript_6547:154-948(-)